MPEERRLAAIMFTDMVGYTALMGRDEVRARELVEGSRERIRSQVERFQGRWLEAVGDGTLSAFPSAVKAADCAIAIQESLRDDPGIVLRVGIHLGDVVFADGRVYGDGVNVASRIEALARPGGVAVSEAVASAIRGHARARLAYLGRKRLKNVDEPVRVYSLSRAGQTGTMVHGFLRGLWERRVAHLLVLYALAALGLAWLARWLAARYGFHGQWVDAVVVALVAMTPAVVAVAYFRADPGRARRADDGERRWHPGRFAVTLNLAAMLVIVAIMLYDAPLPGEPATSIAVLPFANLSQDESNEYFSDGLTDELITTLARLDTVNVAARASSFMFKGARGDVQEIAQKLHVRHILDGSVRKSGDRVRISVQLVDAASGYNVWQQTYDRSLEDIFAVQEDIARSVMSQLNVILPENKSRQLAERPTGNVEAYTFYLQGLEYLHRPTTERNLDLAESLFRNALMLDEEYARAYSGLCRVSLKRYGMTNAPRHIDEGESACRSAMELDASLRDVRVALGNLYRQTGRVDEAEAQFREVLADAPRHADAWIGLGKTLERAQDDGADAAESALRRAVELQPADWSTHMALGEFLFWANRYGEAAGSFERAIELSSDNAPAHHFLGSAYLLLGDLERARRIFRRSVEISPNRHAFRNMGLVHYLDQEYEEAAVYYQRAIEIAPDDHWVRGDLADIYRHLGRDDEATVRYREALQRAREVLDRDPNDWFTRVRSAAYLAYLGDVDAARAAGERVLEKASDDPIVMFYLAQLDVICGQPRSAVEKLEIALERGLSSSFVARHPDLKALRPREDYRLLVARHE